MNMRGAPMGDLQTSALSAEDSNRRRPEATSTVAAKDDNATQNADLEDVHAFLSDDDGRSFVPSSDETESARHSQNPLSRTGTRSSVTTVATAVCGLGVMELSLFNVCRHISEHRSLQQAKIISTECYAENLGGITHRFLVLELWRANRKNVWLRLDRRRGENVSFIKFLASFGVTKANDRAMIAASKDLVAGQARAENRQILGTPPTLNELRILLDIIREEIVQYRLWPENCWFFCSLIQQHLNGAQDGWFESGNLKYARIAQHIRLSVTARFWKAKTTTHKVVTPKIVGPEPNYAAPPSAARVEAAKPTELEPISAPPSVSRMVVEVDPQFLDALRSFSSKNYFPSRIRRVASEILEQIGQLQTFQSFTTVNVSGLCREIIKKLEKLREKLRDARRFAEAIVVLRGAIAFQKYLCPSESEYPLALLMYELSNDLDKSNCIADACATDEELIPILRRLYDTDPDNFRKVLTAAMHDYSAHLAAMGRFEEACATDRVFIKIRRDAFALAPKAYSHPLAWSMINHVYHLHRINQHEEGRVVLEELLSLHREYFEADVEAHKALTVEVLDLRAYTLHMLKLTDQACEVGRECLALLRQLYEQDPAEYYAKLRGSLADHEVHLRDIGRIEEADAICQEFDSLDSPSASSSDSEDE